MSDRQSQAHSTHRPSFNDRFKKVLRLNRDHEKGYYLPKMTGYREHIKNETQLSEQSVLIVAALEVFVVHRAA